jgi:hypothetical protein
MGMKAGVGKPGFIMAAPPVPPRPRPNAVPPPRAVGRVRTELENANVLSPHYLRKLEVVLQTKVPDQNRIPNIANDIAINERYALHYSNYHTW